MLDLLTIPFEGILFTEPWREPPEGVDPEAHEAACWHADMGG